MSQSNGQTDVPEALYACYTKAKVNMITILLQFLITEIAHSRKYPAQQLCCSRATRLGKYIDLIRSQLNNTALI